GNAYIVGQTASSTTFHTTAGSAQTTFGGGPEDAFVVKVSDIVALRPPLAVFGAPNGCAALFTADSADMYGTAPATTLSPFGAVPTDVRVAVGDVNGDGVPDTILVTGPGTPIRFAVVSGVDNTTLLVP